MLKRLCFRNRKLKIDLAQTYLINLKSNLEIFKRSNLIKMKFQVKKEETKQLEIQLLLHTNKKEVTRILLKTKQRGIKILHHKKKTKLHKEISQIILNVDNAR